MTKSTSSKLSRRQALILGSSALAAPMLSLQTRPLWAQETTRVALTLPWVANGSNYWPMLGKEMGIYADNGIDVEVSRGFGSVAAAQAVANDQFDFGVVFASGNMLAQARGLDLMVLGTVNYDATMGIATLADSPIATPKDLEGKTLGMVPTSAEAPFFPAFAAAAGIDTDKVDIVQVDSKVIERALLDGQVDAITAIGSSSIPNIVAAGADLRFMLWSEYGVEQYAAQICTRRETYEANPDLCQKVVDATLQSFAYTLKNPEESINEFARIVPEVGLTANGLPSAKISQGIAQLVAIRPEAIENALGYSDLEKIPGMMQGVLDLGTIENPVVPPLEQLITNEFVGNVTLSAEEWDAVRSANAEYAQYFG
ncbi:ABC transporter substrate-binding protein [Psychromarinibacter halotolerans]|uniref:ABC transporter substrate-binding protein n=1 Tax=Psychromarinibacter halotolerans TaxID=1775175 RepID=A0ABV7GWC2_9RHOB|nr:ABC transporter substrate-binding protein [Psychromarinibacter halotolerans]MDF0596285.1 ABC transporter substrate-binding protein [Psychromarinibacter halotolerans]